MKKNLSLILLLLTLLLVAAPSFAASTKKPTPIPVMKPKPDTIESVSATSITVKRIKMTRNKDKSIEETPITYTYRITQFTSVQINGKSGNVNSLKPGMVVNVRSTGEPGQTPPPEAENIDATDSK